MIGTSAMKELKQHKKLKGKGKWVRLIYATTHHEPKYVHHHPPPPTTTQNVSTTNNNPSKKVFYKKNIKVFYSKVNDEKHFD